MLLQDAYLESQVLTADPMELVRLLYRGARDATRSAGEHLAAGRIAERSRQISKAHSILTQLSSTLDHTRGGTLSHNLAELDDYMQRRLLEANMQQNPEPLQEVAKLLQTMLEGWEQTGTSAQQDTPGLNTRALKEQPAEYGGYPAVFAPYAATEYVSQSWSF